MEEDSQILRVIEAYCTSAKTRNTVNSCKYLLYVLHKMLFCFVIGEAPHRLILTFDLIHFGWANANLNYNVKSIVKTIKLISNSQFPSGPCLEPHL